MGNVTGIIRNVVGILVIMAALGVTWPLQMIAVDGFYKKFVNHCEANGIEFTRLYTRAANSDQLDLASGYIQFTFTAATLADVDCASAATAVSNTGKAALIGGTAASAPWSAALSKLYNEHNEQVVGASTTVASNALENVVVTNAKYQKPTAILVPYSSISTVILGAIPVLSSVTFLGFAGFDLYRGRGGGEGWISMQVMYTIGALIAVIVVLFALPIIFGFFNFAYVASGGSNISGGGPWDVTKQFGDIISIVFEFSPILGILASLGGFAYLSAARYGGQMRGMMRGM